MDLEKYAYRHYRKHTVKQQGSDICLNAENKGLTAFVRDDPFKRHLPWAWTASGQKSARCSMSLRRGLNTPSVKQSVEKQECNYNECGK